MRLWGIALEPFWPALNGSMTSPISVCWRFRISVANRSREPPRIAIAVRSAACRSRWTIWVLAGSAWSPSSARTSASTSGPRWLYVPTGPEILPVAISSTRLGEAAPAAIDLERPAGELEPERGRLGVDGVGPAHHQRVRLAPGAGDQRRQEAVAVAEEELAGVAELERERRVDDVAARQPEVEVAALRPDGLGDLADEGDDVVVGRLLDLGDPLGIDARPAPRSPRAPRPGTTPRAAWARLTASSTRSICSNRACSVQIAPISGSV